MPRRKPTATPVSENNLTLTTSRGPALNPAALICRLTRDPQLRHTKSGRAVSTFRVAVNDGPEPTFHDVVVWGRTAEVVCQYLAKGGLIYAEGRINTRTWTAQDGGERRTVGDRRLPRAVPLRPGRCPAGGDRVMSTTPRIYVACLAAYNNGILHGKWIDVDQSADELHEAVQRMLAASPQPGAEEWAIHDYEGFGKLRVGEWESFERVADIAAGIAEHGPAFTAWLSYDESHDPSDSAAFTDSYRGECDSLRAYAEDYAEQTGMNDAADRAGSPYVVVDIDMLTRDLDIELYTVESNHHTVYAFDPNP